MLLYTGEPKGDKENAACTAPCPHMTANFDGACYKRKGSGVFMIYRTKG